MPFRRLQVSSPFPKLLDAIHSLWLVASLHHQSQQRCNSLALLPQSPNSPLSLPSSTSKYSHHFVEPTRSSISKFLIISVKSLWPCEVTSSQVLGIRGQASRGHFSVYHSMGRDGEGKGEGRREGWGGRGGRGEGEG